MNRRTIQLVASFFLSCLLATILPFNQLHHHDSEPCCSEESAVKDPCHIRIYHVAEAAIQKCEHKAHIHKKEVPCNFCELFHSISNQKYTGNSQHHTVQAAPVLKTIAKFIVRDFKSLLLNSISGRGPPSC